MARRTYTHPLVEPMGSDWGRDPSDATGPTIPAPSLSSHQYSKVSRGTNASSVYQTLAQNQRRHIRYDTCFHLFSYHISSRIHPANSKNTRCVSKRGTQHGQSYALLRLTPVTCGPSHAAAPGAGVPQSLGVIGPRTELERCGGASSKKCVGGEPRTVWRI